jgi:hypothetical protein
MLDTVKKSRSVFTPLNRQRQGSLSSRSLARLLFTLHAIKWNGTLRVREGKRLSYFPVVGGVPGCCAGDVDRQRQVLLGRFAHSHADYQLVSDGWSAPPGFVGFGDPRQLILEGVFGHVAYEELLWELSRFWNHYPVRTQHLAQWGGELGRGAIQRLLDALCTGHHSTRTLVGESPRKRLPLLRALYYAVQVDLIGMMVAPTDETIDLVYTNLRHGNGSRRDGPDRRARAVCDVLIPRAPTTGALRPLPPESGSFARVRSAR